MNKQNNKCLLCGSEEKKIVYEFAREQIPTNFEIRNIVSCGNCGFVFVNPMPVDNYFRSIYASDYWEDYQKSVGEKDIHERLDEFMDISRERIGFLNKFKTGGRFLDVGCSMGFLVKAAEEVGFESYGLDLSEKTLEEGRKLYGVSLFRGTIEDYPMEKFDAIACYNVIEHVVQPDRLIEEMKKRLAPKGVIVIGTHDFECDSHKTQGRVWKHIMPWEHLYYFRLKDIETLAKQHRLDTIWNNKPIDNSIVTYHQAQY